MDLFDQIVPAELTGYIREAQADYQYNQLALSRFLPDSRTPDIEFRYVSGGLGLINAAKYRAWDAESPVAKREGVTRTTVEMAPISEKVRQNEYDRLRLQALAGQEPQVADRIFNDAVYRMRAIAGQLELMRGQALNLGALTVPFADGTTQAVPFGRSGSHDVTAGTLWTDHANSTPLADINAWTQTFITDMGVPPAAMIISRVMLQHLLANKDVKAALQLGTTPAAPSQVTIPQLNNVLDGYGLPPLFLYDVQVNVDGTATRVIPTNRVILVNPDQLGATFYGITAEALELPGIDDAVQEGAAGSGITAWATKTFDPVAVWTKASAVALPGLANPNLTFAATVG